MKKTISNIFKFCLCLLIIAACYYSGIFDKLADKCKQFANELESKQEQGPATAELNEYIESLIIQGQTTADEEERYMALSFALGLRAYEYIVKSCIYSHYTGDTKPPKSLEWEMKKKVNRISDLMKQHYSKEFIGELWASQVNMLWDDVIESNFDRGLGTGWTKWNIDLDYLWELWLSEAHMVNGELDLKMPYS